MSHRTRARARAHHSDSHTRERSVAPRIVGGDADHDEERRDAAEPSRPAANPDPFPDDTEWLAELSHDLKQPLMALRMNLQCAVRLLGAPQPDLAEAQEILAECVDVERSMLAVLSRVRDHLPDAPAYRPALELNELARAIRLGASWSSPSWPLQESLAAPSPEVSRSAWALHFPVARLAAYALRVHRRESANSIPTIEPALEDEQAVLRIGGLSPAVRRRPGLTTFLTHTRLVARRLGGAARLAERDGGVAIVIALPTLAARPARAAGGRHAH